MKTQLPSAQEAIETVLTTFKDMGATSEDLVREAEKLQEDQEYLAGWYETCTMPRV